MPQQTCFFQPLLPRKDIRSFAILCDIGAAQCPAKAFVHEASSLANPSQLANLLQW